MAGGVRGGRKLKAVIPGGSSMPVLPGDVMMGCDMDYDSIAKAGSMLGSGAVIVMDETRCMVKSLLRLSYFYYEESCGQCTPCREGTGWLWRMVDRIEHGKGRNEDLDLLEFGGRQHRGAHDLRAGRRRGAAGARASSSTSATSSSTTSTTSAALYPSTSSPAAPHAEHRNRRQEGRGRAQGSTVMEAAHTLGIYVPHFCYHKKLSIAANCRMCLVQVEKAPKPMPACATPVAEGMKVWTASEPAMKAQRSVMEFLLINHPLDCPICDQGGECQLQDLAVGYGASALALRRAEARRVPQGPRPAGGRRGDDALHPVHALRPLRAGDRRR